jgi:SAM-dependent methyltransferase
VTPTDHADAVSSGVVPDAATRSVVPDAATRSVVPDAATRSVVPDAATRGVVPDTSDWTWVLERPCPECGFDAAALDPARLPSAVEDNATVWTVVLGTDDAAVRPEPHLWSPLEYACHVRDVNRVFAGRLARMLAEDDPEFEDWDQDATAVEEDYGSQDPATVADQVVVAASAVADAYRAVAGSAWGRPGHRSNGSLFTVDTLGRYHLHDLVHHAHDVSYVTRRLTVAAYDAHAAAYRDGTRLMPEPVRRAVVGFAAALEPGARVLEVGSGSGRDARALEEAGLAVRRTDVSRGFVRLLREEGYDAWLLDPLTDDLASPEGDHDGVWASASLLHVRREDLPTVLRRLAGVTRPGGLLRMSVKEGDGARFSTNGHVAAPRHVTFWREGPLRDVLDAAGWEVGEVDHQVAGDGGAWLEVTARRR